MKKNIFYIAIASTLLSLVACSKDVEQFVSFQTYGWASDDPDAGEWKQVVINENSPISIAAPTEVNSQAYQQEYQSMLAKVQAMNDAQKAAADYWTSNPLLRWNEIARDLAAKYNLAPAANAEGIYVAPDINNPSAYPKFPFAHPPYTCRMLAYLQVGMFDGMIECWQWNKTFNRPATHKISDQLQTYYPTSDIPSYPSYGATITGIAQNILTAMFPLEKEYLAEKAKEHLESLIYTGSNVQSDVDAGITLGTQVASEVMKRAANDGMKKAQTPRPVSDSIKLAAFNRFGWQWINQETPERPIGITPLFGKVKLWAVPDITLVRPDAPPAPGSSEFNEAVAELQNIRKNLTSDQRRIANFWSDGTSTYTPPGHWNRLACDFIAEKKLNPVRSARVLAYLNMAIMDAGIACWDAKYYYHYPRPVQAITDFKTILGTPNFPSYTSGHSTFSAAAAGVLANFFPDKKAECYTWAKEASNSRIYGGIHFRFDCEKGLEAGYKVADFVNEIAIKDGAE